MHNGKGFIQEHALADLQAGKRHLRIQPANVIRAAHANMAFVRFKRHQESADAIGGGAQLFHNGIQLFDGLARLIVHFLNLHNAVAQINHVHDGSVAGRQFGGDQINQLQ